MVGIIVAVVVVNFNNQRLSILCILHQPRVRTYLSKPLQNVKEGIQEGILKNELLLISILIER